MTTNNATDATARTFRLLPANVPCPTCGGSGRRSSGRSAPHACHLCAGTGTADTEDAHGYGAVRLYTSAGTPVVIVPVPGTF